MITTENLNLIEIGRAKPEDLPIAKRTAYKWHCIKRNPNLVYKVGGILVFDRGEWAKMAAEAKATNIKEATKIKRGLHA